MYSPAAMDSAAPNYRDQIAMSTSFDAKNAKAPCPRYALWNVTRSTKAANGSRSLDEPDPADLLCRGRTWCRHITTRLRFCGMEPPALLRKAFHSQSRRHPSI